MTPATVGFLGMLVFFALMFARMPIAGAMALVGFVGFAYLRGVESALWQLSTTPAAVFSSSYIMSAIPLFVLMGQLCYSSGLSQELYKVGYAWLGHLRGGLAMATTVACAGFAAVCGSSSATAATMAAVTLPEMKRFKYDSGLATGVLAAGGTMGILIPPSINFVIYGVLTEQSIGKLFLAGIIPGILEAAFYLAAIYVICKRNPLLGPPAPRTGVRDKVIALQSSWPVLVLFSGVMGGIYLGVFTPTEAAAVGAFGALIIGVARRKLSRQGFESALVETGMTTAFILLIVMGATLLGYFLAVTRLPNELARVVGALELNSYVVLAGIIVMYIFLGMVMETLSMILLTVPVLLPIIGTMGYDPIWFGVVIVRMCEIGMITPPIGMNVFIIKGVAKDVPMYTIFRGIGPFFIADIFHVALLIAFPQIALFLPNLLK